MSDLMGPAPVNALNGAHFDGYVRVTEEPLRGMITLRGDLTDQSLRRVATAVTGCVMPDRRGISAQGEAAIAWMSPDELLVSLPLAETGAAMARFAADMSDPALSAVEVSHARSLFSLIGPDGLVREVIAKLAPVDMDPDAFAIGEIRRTHLGQVAAAFWCPVPGRIELVCFRSVAEYVFTILCDAAREDGIVGLYG
ncbi:sarcosine oxidase subunit gamma [Pseudooceanicola algae]|uniref:Uncharacterized protein n=1 Tax=Pseudooceanicola algae TaxID=1537215 RepID=A0A418SC93_9RHOB|nr:sarcosine oxidase subunit gamma family protein [Pseudooceanicola algae]QPM89989.1 hypothetical protein PSAL_012200 [Pseudooceanicola algae]